MSEQTRETSQPNTRVDFYFRRAKKWRGETEKLREFMLQCPLTEELKWGVPCYTHEGRNIVLVHVFKDYCAVLFFKGSLLSDPHRLLVQQTKNVQAGRQIRFTSMRDVMNREKFLKAYITEAIAVEMSGAKVNFKKTTEFVPPEEFKAAEAKTPALTAAFASLTPGRQRAYMLYFSEPKQSKTRTSRIEKSLQDMLDGRGLDDRA